MLRRPNLTTTLTICTQVQIRRLPKPVVAMVSPPTLGIFILVAFRIWYQCGFGVVSSLRVLIEVVDKRRPKPPFAVPFLRNKFVARFHALRCASACTRQGDLISDTLQRGSHQLNVSFDRVCFRWRAMPWAEATCFTWSVTSPSLRTMPCLDRRVRRSALPPKLHLNVRFSHTRTSDASYSNVQRALFLKF